MDIFEQADVFTPSRAVLQEEEEAASSSAASFLRPAVCVWNKRLLRELHPNGLTCDVLVVATCPTSCSLLNAVPGKQLVGSVLCPGVSLSGNSLRSGCEAWGPLPSDRVCCVYSVPGSSGRSGRVLLVCCQYTVARERAPAWARELVGKVTFGHAVFLGAMEAEQFRGQGDPSQEDLIFSLATRRTQEHPGVRAAAPLLPTGTVVGGLPAALLSHCQVRGLSAELLISVEMVVEGRTALLDGLAAALGRALSAHGASAVGNAIGAGPVLALARKSLGLGLQASNVYA